MDDFDTFDPAPIGGSAAHQQAIAESNAYAEQQAQEAMRGALSPPKYGFERFLERGMSMAGGRTLKGDGKGAIYRRGWAKGKTKGQAIEAARGMYARMSPQARARYEDQANMRDVTSKGEQAAAEQYRNQRAALYGAIPQAGGQGGASTGQPRVPNIGERAQKPQPKPIQGPFNNRGRIVDETGDRTAEIEARTRKPRGVYDKPMPSVSQPKLSRPMSFPVSGMPKGAEVTYERLSKPIAFSAATAR